MHFQPHTSKKWERAKRHEHIKGHALILTNIVFYSLKCEVNQVDGAWGVCLCPVQHLFQIMTKFFIDYIRLLRGRRVREIEDHKPISPQARFTVMGMLFFRTQHHVIEYNELARHISMHRVIRIIIMLIKYQNMSWDLGEILKRPFQNIGKCHSVRYPSTLYDVVNKKRKP